MTLRSIAAAAALTALFQFANVELLAQQRPAPPPQGGPRRPVPPIQPRPATAPQPPATQPAQTPAPAQPRVEGPLTNVRVDLTITDQRSGAPAIKKTITVVAADGLLNRIRSSSQFSGPAGEVPLNVDITPLVRQGGKIRLNLTLQYDLPVLPTSGADATKGPILFRTAISETLNTILDDGKAQVIAQSADPVSDRQVMIEVKATIMR